MNELDNHDHSRFLTRTNHRVGRVANVGPYAAAENTNKAVLREAVVIQMTWPGAPTLYYGDEAGQVGFTDPDNRRTYPWGQEDQELIRFYKEMIAVHRRFPVLAMGSLKFLCHDYNVLSYGRFNQEEQVIVIINNRNERVHVEIPVWLTGINRSSVAKLTQVFATDAVGFLRRRKKSRHRRAYWRWICCRYREWYCIDARSDGRLAAASRKTERAAARLVVGTGD